MFSEMNFTPFIFPDSTTWFRFSKYEILENDDGVIHITPANDSKLIMYDPLSMYPEIMEAVIETANHIPNDAYIYCNGPTFLSGDWENGEIEDDLRLEQNKKDIINSILNFTNRYGLLGLYSVFLRHGIQEIRKRFKTHEIYLYYFFPTLITSEATDNSTAAKNELFNILNYFSNTQAYDIPLEPFKDKIRYNKFHLPEGSIINGKDISGEHITDKTIDTTFLKAHYSEPIDLLVGAFRYISVFFNIWTEYTKSGYQPHDYYKHIPDDFCIDCFDVCKNWKLEYITSKITWEERLKQFCVNGITSNLSINISNEFELETRFESLFDVISYMFLQGISTKDQHQKIRICEREGCSKIIPFDKSPKAKYCSDACKNIVSAKQWRKNVKAASDLFDKGNTHKEIAKILNTNEAQVKRWLRSE